MAKIGENVFEKSQKNTPPIDIVLGGMFDILENLSNHHLWDNLLSSSLVRWRYLR